MSDVVRHPAKHSPAHSQKPSETLMRSAVKKPVAAQRKHSKAQGHIDGLVKSVPGKLIPKKSVAAVDNKRLVKARKFPQSKLIQHFSQITSDSNRFEAVVPVQASRPTTPQAESATQKTISKPKSTADLLDHALRHATTHEHKTHHKPKNRRGLKITAAAALLVLAGGVLISQQMPNMRMHMASAKAGFHASLPDYRPAGYSISKLDSNDGVVATTFQSNSDQRQYTLTQKTSNWDSQALLDNFVIIHDKDYSVSTVAGRTVYIYGDRNATWVNGGIWYIVQTNGSLTDNQLTQLASSL